MKKIFLFLFFMLLSACSESQTSFDSDTCKKLAETAPELTQKMSIKDACDKAKNENRANWADKSNIINVYENCIAKMDDEFKDQQIESMLFLSYIYLSNGEYHNAIRADNLIDCALNIMWRDCDENTDSYGNVCYMKKKFDVVNEYTDKVYEILDGEDMSFFDYIPETIDDISDVKELYQMALPCIPLQMLLENPDLIDITKSFFGGGLDTTIPGVCAPYDPFEMIGLLELQDMENYEKIDDLNPAPTMEGTMRFSIRRDAYSEAIEMIAWPKKFFKNKTIKDLHNKITYDVFDEKKEDYIEKNFDLHASDVEKQIRKYKNLSDTYDKMITKLKNHYINVLKMDKKDADNYAKLAVISMIMDMVSFH